ncbi:MAG: hypothetical protein ACKVW3_14070 [Phycisphaerales bacterium]
MNAAGIIVVVVGVMLVAGVFFALVWWQMADVIFPGASKKTGQRILGRAEGKDGGPDGVKAPPPGARVVRFEDEPKNLE